MLLALPVVAECMNLLSESELSVAVSKCSRCKLAYFCSKVGPISGAGWYCIFVATRGLLWFKTD
jgi:hypothetical protein